MTIVLDTVCLHNILRQPIVRTSHRAGFSYNTCLDKYLKKKILFLAVDYDGGLINEWKETCNEEVVKIFITKWEESIRVFKNLPILADPARRKLRIIGFNDPIDKLILRIALSTKSRVVVSNDPDFWDPSSISSLGDPNAKVANLCSEDLKIIVMLLSQLVNKL